MKGFILDIICDDKEVAKAVETGIRFAGSGSYEHPDDLTFRLNMNPMHVPLICTLCLKMAESASIEAQPVSFWHNGEMIAY